MTRGVLSDESLALLDPAFVSPGLLGLTGEEAPTRTILCAGAGHFATAHVTLSQGLYIGTRDTAGAQLVEDWAAVANRAGDVVPAYGFIQAERELASAGGEVGVRATLR